MKYDDIDTQITMCEAMLMESDSDQDTDQISYELSKLRFNKQLLIVKERIEKIRARPNTRELLKKYIPVKF